jgi:hypothetical protein
MAALLIRTFWGGRMLVVIDGERYHRVFRALL